MMTLILKASARKPENPSKTFIGPHLHIKYTYIEHIGRLARMSVLDTEVDGSNPGNSMLFP